MIDEEITFILFKYTSKDLSPGSHKKVLTVCNECGKERLIPYQNRTDLCRSCSCTGNKNHMFGKNHTKESKQKMSKNKQCDNNPMFGKHHSEDTKQKISKSNIGKQISEKTKQKISKSKIGVHHSEESKQKMSNSRLSDKNHMFGKTAENNPNWKGGKKLSNAKERTKRRKLFGFIPHNKPRKDFHGHHLDFNHVIFIPKELHRSIYHSVTKNINMNIINDIACDWYLEYQIGCS